MPTLPIAVETCQFQDTAHGGVCTIKSGLSQYTTINGKKVCLQGLVVTVVGGTIPGPQVDPVDITFDLPPMIAPLQIKGTKIEGKIPLALGEVSSGLETGKYTVGQSVQTLPITLTLVDAGQQFVKAQ